MFNKILVAINDTDIAETVVNDAVTLAQAMEAKIFLLNVVSPFDTPYPNPGYLGINGDSVEYYMEYWESLKAQGLELLKKFSDRIESQSVSVESRLVVGNPGHLICSFAQNNDIDLIMMGRRGRSGVSEMLLGSVSNYVVHHAPCCVLTIQGRELEIKNNQEAASTFVQ